MEGVRQGKFELEGRLGAQLETETASSVMIRSWRWHGSQQNREGRPATESLIPRAIARPPYCGNGPILIKNSQGAIRDCPVRRQPKDRVQFPEQGMDTYAVKQ